MSTWNHFPLLPTKVTLDLLLLLQAYSTLQDVLRRDSNLIKYSKIRFVLHGRSKYQMDQHKHSLLQEQLLEDSAKSFITP
jgi:hypothetical protein